MSSTCTTPPRIWKAHLPAVIAGGVALAIAGTVSAIFLVGGSAGSDELDLGTRFAAIECPEGVGIGSIIGTPYPPHEVNGKKVWLGGSPTPDTALTQFLLEENIAHKLTDYIRNSKTDTAVLYERVSQGKLVEVISVVQRGDQWFAQNRRGCAE